MFGRKANLPIDFNVVATYDADEKLGEFLQVKCMVEFVIVYKIIPLSPAVTGSRR